MYDQPPGCAVRPVTMARFRPRGRDRVTLPLAVVAGRVIRGPEALARELARGPLLLRRCVLVGCGAIRPRPGFALALDRCLVAGGFVAIAGYEQVVSRRVAFRAEGPAAGDGDAAWLALRREAAG